MLSSPSQKKMPEWPQLKKENNTSVKLINVTGSQAKTTTPKTSRRNGSDSEPETEGYVPVPAFSRSFSDAIAAAFEKASNQNEANTCERIS